MEHIEGGTPTALPRACAYVYSVRGMTESVITLTHGIGGATSFFYLLDGIPWGMVPVSFPFLWIVSVC